MQANKDSYLTEYGEKINLPELDSINNYREYYEATILPNKEKLNHLYGKIIIVEFIFSLYILKGL